MADFVIDNSIVMSWCFVDEKSTYADRVLAALVSRKAVVPAIWPLEVGNILLVAERRNRLCKADSIRFIELIHDLPIRVVMEEPGRMISEIFALAREHVISTYDASYLDLAMRNGLPVATMDKALLQAAKKCKVHLFEPPES